METVKLNNGVEMPVLGYGVYQVNPAECERCVTDALAVGYRSVDTAQAYYNEEGVGAAIAKSGIDRHELFITSKIWVSNFGYDKAAKSIDESLRKLGTDYIDLMLLHQPYGDYYGAYHAMEEAYKAGKLRAIGISNFYPDRVVDIFNFCEVKPAVNQIETHPFFQRTFDHKYLSKYGIAHESWGPFDEGKNGIFTNPVLKAVGDRYGKSVGQTVLRFLIQSGVIVIPKSTHKERMIENLNVFDFKLDDDDMNSILKLDTGKSSFFDHRDPETVEMFMKWIK
jgi:2,5-diketo-D-gluconate reductase A